MQQLIRQHWSKETKHAKQRGDTARRAAAPEQKDTLRREIACELESDHAAERRACKVEWLSEVKLARQSLSVLP